MGIIRRMRMKRMMRMMRMMRKDLQMSLMFMIHRIIHTMNQEEMTS